MERSVHEASSWNPEHRGHFTSPFTHNVLYSTFSLLLSFIFRSPADFKGEVHSFLFPVKVGRDDTTAGPPQRQRVSPHLRMLTLEGRTLFPAQGVISSTTNGEDRESREPLLLVTEITTWLPAVGGQCKANVFHEWNCSVPSGCEGNVRSVLGR